MRHILNDWAIIDENPFISEQLSYNRTNELRLVEHQIPQLNVEQKAAYDFILNSVYVQSSQTFFLNGPVETRKTFVY
jgi:hypothetical protein